MKILVADYELSDTPGGAQTYNLAIIEELGKNHSVEVVSLKPLGILSKILNTKGFNVYNQIPKHLSYDLILASHKPTVEYIRQRNINGLLIQTCHGITEPNQPGPADLFVAVSEEVQNHLKQFNVNSTVILNGINCDTFYPKRSINVSIKRVLSLCQTKKANDIVEQACLKYNVEFIFRNKNLNPIYQLQNDINHADLVVSLGRGCYEAMACGRAVIVFDHRPYYKEPLGDGIVSQNNINDIIKHNCSGRYSNKSFGVKEIIEEFEKYDCMLEYFGRNYVTNHLNIKKQVDKYLKLN